MAKNTIAVLRDYNNRRSITIANALHQSLRRLGWNVPVIEQVPFASPTIHELRRLQPTYVAAYGWSPATRWAADAFGSDRIIHIDLGFWNRKPTDNIYGGHHRISVGRWPVLRPHSEVPIGRLEEMRLPLFAGERGIGDRVLLCGMSGKAAQTFGFRPQEWEADLVQKLRNAGARVTYRPKPSWAGRSRIEGAAFQDGNLVPMVDALDNVDAVATYHGNSTIDALIAGLPYYVEDGIALIKKLGAETVFHLINQPSVDFSTRLSVLKELAWHQWSLQEITAGKWLEAPSPMAFLSERGK